MTTQFQIGQTYKYRSIVTITITRRTDKSVWFEIDGKEVRRGVKMMGNYEYIQYDELYIVDAHNVVAETIEVNETVKTESNEPNTAESSATETTKEQRTMTTNTITPTERRELINQLTHYSILLNNTEYDTEKWNAIFDKTQELRAAIEKLS